MKGHKNLEQLQRQYDEIEIPDELEFLVRKKISEQRKVNKMNKGKAMLKTVGISAAAVACLFVGSVNISPAVANTLAEVPALAKLIEVVTIKEYNFDDGNFQAGIKVPQVSGLENKALEEQMNAQFIKEGQAQYQQFLKEMEAMEKEGHFSVESSYEVKTDNDRVFSIVINNLEIAASGAESFHTYTIDKKNQAMVTLESLFNSDQYIEVISKNIIEQMEEQMAANEEKVYFIHEDVGENFTTIKADQNFYINADSKLVIQFDEYEVAPGSMGGVSFVIPTEEIQGLLLDRGLIK